MKRRFSSNTSINLIQFDTELEVFHKVKSNSLVEMFDPIFDKQFQTAPNKLENSSNRSSLSDDIFAPTLKHDNVNNRPNKVGLSDNEIFEDFVPNDTKTSKTIYPNLSSFKSIYSNERYGVFDTDESDVEINTSYDLRPSLFKELKIDRNCSTLFNDGYANKDMERFMKTVTELQMQSLNLSTNEKSHLIFNPTLSNNLTTNEYQSNTIRILVEISDSILSTTEPYSIDADIFQMSERSLVNKVITTQCPNINDSSMVYLRIFGRGEYLKQGEFPLIQNQLVFQCYRSQKSLKLVLELLDFTESKYTLRDNIAADASSKVYQLLDEHFFNVSRFQVENGFLALYQYRNSIVSTLREYKSSYLDLPTIEASLDVFKDKCKSLCVICNNMYTANIAQQILEMEGLESVMNIAFSSKNIIEEALSKSVENLIKGLDQTIRHIIHMINQVTIFCNCNFSVRPEQLSLAGQQSSQSGIQSISKCRKQFSVKLGSICSFKDIDSFSSFYIKLSVKVGRQSLSKFLNIKLHNVSDTKISNEKYSLRIHPKYPKCIPFNETILFENLSMALFPLETTLLIHIYGNRLPSSDSPAISDLLIGWSEVALFDSGGILRQGKMLLGIWPNSVKHKCFHGTNRLQNSAILEVELPDFHVPVKYSNDKATKFIEISYLKQTTTEGQLIEQSVNSMWLNNNQSTAKQCCDLLWKHRGYIMKNPRQYIALCLALVSAWPEDCECENKDFLLNYIERCHLDFKEITSTEIIHLLGSHMPLIKMRRWATQKLREIGSDRCISLICWLVEALKYESNLNSSGIEHLLLHFSLININFSTYLYWKLSSVNFDEVHGYKAILLLGMLHSLVNSAILDMWSMQSLIVKNLEKAATAVKQVKSSSERKNTMHSNLEELYDVIKKETSYSETEEKVKHPLTNYRIPYQSGLVLRKLEIQDCSYFNSCTLPLRIIFNGLDNNRLEIMFKSGDDLRQDILVLELFKLMDDLWISEGLDLRMVHYKVMNTGLQSGLVQLVEDCTTLRKIQEIKGIAAPLTSVNGISEWLKCQNTTKATYLQSVNNFLLTSAACCVSTYLLGIGDRHNDNIMIQTNGCVFHIDFAKILGDAQTFAGIKRDRVPFVLTQEMVHVLEDYQPPTDDRRTGMQVLIDKCCEAYNIIRRHWSSLLAILLMASEANIPGVNSKTIQYVMKMLQLESSDIQASEQYTDLIRKSVNSISTSVNFLIHNLAQLKYSTNNEGSLFSFTPKIYRDEPRIMKILIRNMKKVNKYYTYKIWVQKENMTKPEVVFRRYEHFIELGQHMAALFRESTLPKLYQTILQPGPPSSTISAESRKTILQQFSSSLLLFEDEISQCDLMTTFFHATVADEQLCEDDLSLLKDDDTLSRNYPEIQIKFHLSNRDSKLEIFVKHARNLVAFRLNEPPNPYVKTYILPGYMAKKKSGVIMRNSSPSFNDIITYNHFYLKPDTKIEISVWHNETLGENFCIGSVVVPISKTMVDKEEWYQLNTPQNGDAGSRQDFNLSWNRNVNKKYLIQSVPGDVLVYDGSKLV